MGILRFILALAVVGDHTHRLFPFYQFYSELAVKTFFIISGFYMALILKEKYAAKNSYKLFITNRFLRIYPLYAIILLLSFLVCQNIPVGDKGNHLTVLKEFAQESSWWQAALIILANIVILGQDIAYFFYTPYIGEAFFIPQSWTLSLEFMFYLIVPWLVRLRASILVCVCLLSLILRAVLANFKFDYDPWQLRFFPVELSLFLIGIFCYKIYDRIRDRRIPQWINMIILGLTIGIMLFFKVITGPDTSRMTVNFTMYFAVIACALPFIFHLTRHSKFDQWIGEFSYPIYIVHLLIKTVLINGGFIKEQSPWLGWTVAGASFVFSLLLLQLIIYPIDKIRKKRVSTCRIMP